MDDLTHAVLTPVLVPAYEIRVFTDGNTMGDHYAWCGLAKHHDDKTVEIGLTMAAPSLAARRAIARALVEHTQYKEWIRKLGDGRILGPFGP